MKGEREERGSGDMTRGRAVAICVLLIVVGVPFLGAIAGGGYGASPAAASSYPGDPFRLPRMLEDEEPEDDPEEEPRVIRRHTTQHVPAEVIQEVAGSLGIDVQTVIFPTNSHAMWARGTEEAHAELRDLLNTADAAENHISLGYEMLSLEYISPERAVDLLEDVGLELERYFYFGSALVVLDDEVVNQWGEVADMLQTFDAPPAQEEVIFTFSLEHLSASDASGILDSMGFEGVSVRPFDYPDEDIARELVVVCPPHLEDRVHSTLEDIDGRRSSIRMPLDSARGEGARDELEGKRGLLSRLSGVSDRAMRISQNLTGDDDDPWYVLWVEETPDNIQLLQSLLDEFD